MQNSSLTRYTMTYGLYLGLAFSIVIMIFKFRGGIHIPGDSIGMINTMMLIFSMSYLGRRYRDTYEVDSFTYGKALGFNVQLVLFSAIIYTLFSYLYYAKIEPGAINYYITQIQAAYSQSNMFSESQAEFMTSMYKKMLTPGVMAFVVFILQMLSGIVLGLLMAIFTRTPVNLLKSDLK